MAGADVDAVSDPFPLDNALGSAPDSSPLRVSLDTQFESGIPPARLHRDRDSAPVYEAQALTLADGVPRMDSALANLARTEANLGQLLRGLKHLEAAAGAARAANIELMHELDELRVELSRSHDQEYALGFRITQLERLLALIRQESAREREFLIDQQDRFLVEILSDHDRQLDELRRSLESSKTRTVESREILELTLQRDQAREYAIRCERERDAAWHELTTHPAPSPASNPVAAIRRYATPSPEAPETSPARENSTSSATAIGAINLRAVPASPAALNAPDTVRSSARPGTGYSLTTDEVCD